MDKIFRLHLHNICSTAVVTFRLHLLQIRLSDLTLIWIGCLNFIYITFASTVVQTFRLHLIWIRCSDFIHITFSSIAVQRHRLLQIRHLDFAFIWISCSNFICITFASIIVQTFRLRLLQIKRYDFAFIWIRCLDFICITFASTAIQTFRLRLLQLGMTLPSYYGSDIQTSFVSHLLALQFRRSDLVFYRSGVQTSLYMD